MSNVIALDFTRVICKMRKDECKKEEGYWWDISYTEFYDLMKRKYGNEFDFFKYFEFDVNLLRELYKLKSEGYLFYVFAQRGRAPYYSIHEDAMVRRVLVEELKLFEDIVTSESKIFSGTFKLFKEKIIERYGKDSKIVFVEENYCSLKGAVQADVKYVFTENYEGKPALYLQEAINVLEKGESEDVSGFTSECKLT